MRRFAPIVSFAWLLFAAWPAQAQGAGKPAPAPEAGKAAPGAGQAAPAPEAAEPQPPPPPKAKSLDELLELVKQGWREETAEDQEREARFRREKAEQEKLLADAQATLARLEARSLELERIFQEHEVELAKLEETLASRLGTLGELFGVVRQVSGDTAGQVIGSLTSAQLDGRQEFLEELGKSKALPSLDKLERLWYELTREMTEQGRVVRFQAPVLTAGGNEVAKDVIRAGVFTAVADGRYVIWDESIGKIRELARQPPARYVDTVSSFESAESGMAGLAVDPSRGSLLSVLIDTRTLWERLPEGGWVGYLTIVLGVIAALVAVLRWAVVTLTTRKVLAQQKSERADTGNPLGRVMAVYEENRAADPETLELRLDEAVLRETSALERFIWLIKVVSILAPLLGLLGTVTGMIRTFQAITLFGAGDPKMMAGGISEALVTTFIGLTVAIPLVLLHALLANNTKRITDILDEQSAGLIARQTERAGV
jgi:biopolymer transport protein ExbB